MKKMVGSKIYIFRCLDLSLIGDLRKILGERRGIEGMKVLFDYSLSNCCNGFLSLVSSSHSFYICQEARFTGYLGYEFDFLGSKSRGRYD